MISAVDFPESIDFFSNENKDIPAKSKYFNHLLILILDVDYFGRQTATNNSLIIEGSFNRFVTS